MKGSVTQFILLLLLLTSRSFAQDVTNIPKPDKDPFVGNWKADADKSRPKLNNIQASYLRTMSREGDDLLFYSGIEKRNSAGLSENRYRIRCDGLAHRVQCGVLFRSTSCMYLSGNRVEGETKSQNDGTSYWAREVSQDGQEMRIYSY